MKDKYWALFSLQYFGSSIGISFFLNVLKNDVIKRDNYKYVTEFEYVDELSLHEKTNVGEHIIEILSGFLRFGGASNFSPLVTYASIYDVSMNYEFARLFSPTLDFDIIQKQYETLCDTEKQLMTKKNIQIYTTIPYIYIHARSMITTVDFIPRVLFLGIVYRTEYDKLLSMAIKYIKISHNTIYDIMSGFTAVLFASFSVQEINIIHWCSKMITILESDIVKKHFDLDDIGNMRQYIGYISMWDKFRSARFENDRLKITKSDFNLSYRYKFASDFMTIDGNIVPSVYYIITMFNVLLECKGDWEKLFYYSITSLFQDKKIYMSTFFQYVFSMYGLTYGINNIPQKYINNIKDIDKDIDNTIHMLGETYFDKYSI